MAGQSIAQKILARASGQERVDVGDYVTAVPDHFVGMELVWPVHARNLERTGAQRFARPDKVVFVVDHTPAGAMGTAHHASHRLLQRVAERFGVERFFGAGSGLRHQVMVEQGFARPGALIFSDEPNIASVGVVGALNVPMTTDALMVLLRDENWVPVPATVRIDLHGALRPGVFARDLAQRVIRDFAGRDDMLQACIEFGGPGLASLSLDERQALLACAFHTGADTAVMEVDAAALAYVDARAAGRPYTVMCADADCDYRLRTRYDLDAIEPMVTPPPTIHGAVPVSEVAGLRIDQATVGSCAGNRLDDLRAAAQMLAGRRIARQVTMYVSPGSREIYAQAAREGLLATFAEAGATVMLPGCNTCWGYQGLLSGDEVSISTHQYNYRGRNGSRDARIHLASAATVAASAVAGEIRDPRSIG